MYTSKSRGLLSRAAILIVIVMFIPGAIYADGYDSIATKYNNENAVIVNYTRQMVIKNENGKLVATSYITKEKLFISDVSAGLDNTDYLFHSDFNKLVDLKATASLPAKTGYKKVPCYNFANVSPEKDYVFYDDSRYEVVSYTGLQKNALTETKYAIEHSDLDMLPPFTFQEGIPVVKATFEVIAPRYVNVNFVVKGVDTGWIKRTTEERGNTVTYKFTATDIPAYKEFDNVPSVWYYLTHVITYVSSYKMPGSDKVTNMVSNADDLYKYLYKYVKGLNMQNDTALDNKVAALTKNDHSPKEKAAHIYEWVQQNLHYVAFEKGMEGFVPREASLVLKRKYGDCKDMSSMLVTMCRKAGLNAYYTWIGTEEKPYTFEETPLPLVNNHMICALKVDGDWIFMDGTHPLIPFGENPESIQGKEAMISIDANNYKIVTIPITSAEKNVMIDSTVMDISGRKITGSIKQTYKGYEAWDIGIMMMYRKNGDRDKAVTKLTRRGSDKFEQNKYDVIAGDKGNKDMAINADFTVDDYVQKSGNQCYVNMNLRRTFEDKNIDKDGRMVASYAYYKEKIKEVVVLNIPKGYRVSTLPAAAHNAVSGLWSYSIYYKSDNKKITLVKEYELNTLAIKPKQFDDNNKLADELKKLYKESVVLTAN